MISGITYGSPSPYTLGILRVVVRRVKVFAERTAASTMALDLRYQEARDDSVRSLEYSRIGEVEISVISADER